MNTNQSSPSLLPHHRLHAYAYAMELMRAVRDAGIRDTHLRDQAMRAARSAVLNTAEGAARVSPRDKARAFAIARGEAAEAAAAIEIAHECGEVNAASAKRVIALANSVVAMLTPLAK